MEQAIAPAAVMTEASYYLWSLILLGIVAFATVAAVALAIWKAHREKGRLLLLVKDESGETRVRVSNEGPPAVVIEEAGLLLPKGSPDRCIPLEADGPKKGRLERGDHQDYVPTIDEDVKHMVSRAIDKPGALKRRPVAYAKTAEGKCFYSVNWLARWWRGFHRVK